MMKNIPAMPTGFNEAAVLQPRNGYYRPKRSSPHQCFNEAAVLQPRNVELQQTQALDPLASMRPRFFNRGMRGLPVTGSSAMRSFNEAAVLQPRNGAAP